VKRTFRDVVKLKTKHELPFGLHGKSLGRELCNFNFGGSLDGLNHGKGVPIVEYDDMSKIFGALANMDSSHYGVDWFGVLLWKKFLPIVFQVHRFWRPTIFLENPWPCVNKQN